MRYGSDGHSSHFRLSETPPGRLPAASVPTPVRAALVILVILFPALLLLPGLNAFPYPSPEAQFSDLTISHYPNLVFLRSALSELGTFPLWSPAILSGFPFAANPLSELWYPPGWLAWFLPLPLAFNLLVVLHLIWGGLGLYALLRREGLAAAAAIIGALAFAGMPKLYAHYGAGHLTLLFAVPWTPWLMLAQTSPLLSPAHASLIRRVLSRLGQPAVILALIFLADARWAAYAGVLWIFYALLHPGKQTVSHSGPGGQGLHRLPNRVSGQIRALLFQVRGAVMLAAPLALPLWEYTRLSTRASLEPTDVFSYSLPPGQLFGLIFPNFGGFHEWMLYPGGLVLILSLLALLWPSTRRRVGFWAWTAGLSLLVSLGPLLPGMAVLARLPGLDLLRVPSRALFAAGFAFAALAAYAADHLLVEALPSEKRTANLLLAGLAGFTLVLAGGAWALSGNPQTSFNWGAAAALLAALWIGLLLRARISPQRWWAGLVLLCLLDLTVVDRSLFTSRPAEDVLEEGSPAAAYLSAQHGLFRVFSPSYSLPQQTAARYQLQLADGVDPLQLSAYTAYMQEASGVPAQGYSVTLPPFTTGDPAVDNAAYFPNPDRLGLLNVRFVLAAYDLPVDGLALRERFGETRVYENLRARPRGWVQPRDAPLGHEARPVDAIHWTPNRVEIRVNLPEGGNQLLVLSELAYPGWQARVDGQRADIQTAVGLLRAVELESGEHEVIFTYRPLSLLLGLALAGIGMVIVLRGRPGGLGA